MVRIAPPPLSRPPKPIHYMLPAGVRLLRIYDPTRFDATATSFRHFGPLDRFDHHHPTTTGDAHINPDRGILYAGLTLSCCIAEVFGDRGAIETGTREVAELEVVRPLLLLDLRDDGAMRAGTVSAIGKIAGRPLSQEWSRYFYERASHYLTVDGLIWYGAHNDEECVALFERADDAIVCPTGAILLLDDPRLRPTLLDIAQGLNLVPPL